MVQWLRIQGFPGDQLVKNSPAMQEMWVWSLDWEDPLEKGKATHSSILIWKIPWAVLIKNILKDWYFSFISLCLLSLSYIFLVEDDIYLNFRAIAHNLIASQYPLQLYNIRGISMKMSEKH